ncbi:MAG: hypothetical protein NTZ46_03370 [Verrucomicrobia bacterium]|nr:hypothetical protein [Verrucomicrobiota bacterium]
MRTEMHSKQIPLLYALVITLCLCVFSQQYFLDTQSPSPLPPIREQDKLPPDFTLPKLSIPNSCFLSSLNLRGAYVAYCVAHKYRYWAKLLMMQQISKSDPKLKLAHVVCVFEYFGRFYVYDANHGVYLLTEKDLRRARASEVAPTLKQPEDCTLGQSLWVEES